MIEYFDPSWRVFGLQPLMGIFLQIDPAITNELATTRANRLKQLDRSDKFLFIPFGGATGPGKAKINQA